MKPKKSKQANLENYRSIFLQIGLILALTAILASFEWKTKFTFEKLTNDRTVGNDITELPPITRPEKEKEELIKPPEPISKLEIVKNDIDIKEEPIFLPTDIEWNIPIPDFKKEEEVVDDNEYIKVQFMPRFNGQDAAYFRNYVSENLKFPFSAVESGVTGTVFVSFVIEKDGSVSKVEILRGVHPVLDKAVVEAIQRSPSWEPGIQEGKFVKVRYSIAISFRLE
ncbi:MAG TPA: energy transducer TonB [Bacteroidales bacterium]|nr:energy transducer TonB [Bacteroidales bacterium]